MADNKAKRGRGRPPKDAADTHPKRVVFMADAAAHAWLYWRSAETGAPISEIMRRALAFYIAANPAPKA
jgi:AT hook motif